MAAEMSSFYTASTNHVSSHSPQIVEELISKYSSSMSHNASIRGASYARGRGLIRRCIDRALLEYYRYEVTFGVYVMTPGEKFVANAFVLVVLSLFVWAGLLYFPQLLFRKLGRLVWLLTGHNEHVAALSGMFEHNYMGAATAAMPTSSMAA